MLEITQRPIGLDDLSDIRFLHSSAFKMCASDEHTLEEINAFVARVYSEDYIRDCLNCSLYGAWHGSTLVGTAGWCPSSDNNATARIRKVFVHGFYMGLGIGRLMVESAEARARNAGFKEFSIRSQHSSSSFFLTLGYHVSSHGVLGTPAGPDLPVTFLRKKDRIKRAPIPIQQKKPLLNKVLPAFSVFQLKDKFSINSKTVTGKCF